MAAQAISQDAPVIRQSQELAKTALGLRVTNNAERIEAAEMGKSIAALQKQVAATFDPIISSAHEAHRVALAKKAEVWDPLDRAKRYLAGCIGGYDQQQERLRREEQARLDREARERAAEDEARLRREAEDRQLAEAEVAHESGDEDLAEAILSAKPIVDVSMPAPAIVPRLVADVPGAVTRKAWKFRVVNEALIPHEYMAVDEKKIGAVVRAMKGMTKIPGVEVYEEASTAFRG